jgi:flagellar protein FliS
VNASTAVEGASSHKLVSLLFQTLASEIAGARGAISRGDIAGKGRAISHAVRIIQEGLLAPLDMQAGGALAVNLRDLYEYLVNRLTFANLKSDDNALAECAKLVDVIREGWDAIAGRAEQPTLAAA